MALSYPELEYGSVAVSWDGNDLGQQVGEAAITIDRETFPLNVNFLGNAAFDTISLGRSATVTANFAQVNELVLDGFWSFVYAEATDAAATHVRVPVAAGQSERENAGPLILTPDFNNNANSLRMLFHLASPPEVASVNRGLEQTIIQATFQVFPEEVDGVVTIFDLGEKPEA